MRDRGLLLRAAVLCVGAVCCASALGAGEVCHRVCGVSAVQCVPLAQAGACQTGTRCTFQNESSTEAVCAVSWSGCIASNAEQILSGPCAAGAVTPYRATCTVQCAGGPQAGSITCAATSAGAAFTSTCFRVTATAAPTAVVGTPSPSDSVTSKAWFWVLVLGLPLLVVLLCAAAALYFYLQRGHRFWGGKRTNGGPAGASPKGREDAQAGGRGRSPRNPICFKSPPRSGPANFGVLQDKNKRPLVSALKGSPQRPRRSPPPNAGRKGVTFSQYHPGDTVEAQYEGKWFQCVVQGHNADGTYTVLWLPGGQSSSNINTEQIRRLVQQRPYPDSDYSDYGEMQQLQCLWQNEWHVGLLEAVNVDGTYVIRWFDGTYTPNMDPADTKPA